MKNVVEKIALYGGEPVRKKPLKIKRPIGKEELEELKEVIESGQLFRWTGTKVRKFEEEFAKFYGVKYAVACTSGTASIHIAVGAINPNPCSEIITTPITDIGTVIPILAQNCIPIFADINVDDYTLDPRDIERRITEKTKIIIPVHQFGYPCDMDPIMEIAEKYGLYVIEDCCQAYLAEYKGKLVGTIGHFGCFSLQMSKHMTTGDGGIVITNDDELAQKAKLFMDKGWIREAKTIARSYVMFGFNYRMTELQGAVALAQLKKVKWVVQRRREIGEQITKELGDLEGQGIHLPKSTKERKHSFWLYPIRVDPNVLGVSNVEFANALKAEGIPAGAGYIGEPLYMAPYLREKRVYGSSKCPFECPLYGKSQIEYKKGLCPNAEKVLRELVTIPCNELFTDEDVEDIIRAIEKVTKYFLTHKNK